MLDKQIDNTKICDHCGGRGEIYIGKQCWDACSVCLGSGRNDIKGHKTLTKWNLGETMKTLDDL